MTQRDLDCTHRMRNGMPDLLSRRPRPREVAYLPLAKGLAQDLLTTNNHRIPEEVHTVFRREPEVFRKGQRDFEEDRGNIEEDRRSFEENEKQPVERFANAWLSPGA